MTDVIKAMSRKSLDLAREKRNFLAEVCEMILHLFGVILDFRGGATACHFQLCGNPLGGHARCFNRRLGPVFDFVDCIRHEISPHCRYWHRGDNAWGLHT
ncbi:MAG: hypothetical protein ABI377_07510, partial [Devosia sp.]